MLILLSDYGWVGGGIDRPAHARFWDGSNGVTTISCERSADKLGMRQRWACSKHTRILHFIVHIKWYNIFKFRVCPIIDKY